MREDQTEVLVAGAGPVGLWTALLLKEAGIETAIIDREERTAARSYACALHPHTLSLLEPSGLAAQAIELGRRVDTLAFYEGASRQAEVKLSRSEHDYPFLLILPQNAFESLLEQRLAKAGVKVNWNHRFDAMQQDLKEVTVTVEELGGTSTGYIVPHWETTVKNRREVHAQYLIGADGNNSLVRQRLGIESEVFSPREFFAAYEFEAEGEVESEIRVVLDESSTNVLWPLAGNRCRWTFQLSHPRPPSDFPEKERRAVRLSQPVVDEKIKEYIQRVAQRRAPWFSSSVKEITWCTEVTFEQRLVKHFGKDRCWLVGDAAHQTGPVGVQSMNAGFAEAASLVASLRKGFQERAAANLSTAYEKPWHHEWERLLGKAGGLKSQPGTAPWAKQQSARLLPCLPGFGAELGRLASQLMLEFPG